MSRLVVKRQDAPSEVQSRPLDGCLVAIEAGARPVPISRTQLARWDGPVLVRGESSRGEPTWALLVPPGHPALVNGQRTRAGVRLLADGDDIAFGDGRATFHATRRGACVEPFPGAVQPIQCVRCRLPLQANTPAVRCPQPGCGFWHHQGADQPCWTYTDACAACGHSTALDGAPGLAPGER